MPDPITIEAVTKTASFAAAQNDRWLFVALLIIFLLAIGFMARWFMARNDSLQVRVDNLQKEFNDFLQTRHSIMAAIVEKNTLVLEKSAHTLEVAAGLLKSASENFEKNTP